jgi:hypothetical protein
LEAIVRGSESLFFTPNPTLILPERRAFNLSLFIAGSKEMDDDDENVR